MKSPINLTSLYLFIPDNHPPKNQKKCGVCIFFSKKGGDLGGKLHEWRHTFMKKLISFTLSLILLIALFSGCNKKSTPDPDNPVMLTMWHVYGSQTKSPLNLAIDKFNNTVGKEKGIIVNVVSVTSSSAIDKALSDAANDEPGAEELPDLFTAYPRVAELVGKERLLSWNDYFSKTELSGYKKEFLEEGYFGDRLLMLPVAKSSEVFYLNKTLFDKFSAMTSCKIEDLSSFDGLFKTANLYYDLTNQQNFMQINDLYHYALIGMQENDAEFIKNGNLNLSDPMFEAVWRPLAKCAIYGGICLDDGYAASRWKTAEVISNIGSTADVLYQPDKVIYADNSTENIQAISMPYPTFTKKTGASVHRGGGLFAIKSEDERKNHAAYIFAKWITEDENNLEFVTHAGYLPVKDTAFEKLFADESIIKNENYRSMYQSVQTMVKDYSLYALPLFDGASEIQHKFEENARLILKTNHMQYEKRVLSGENKESVLNELTEHSLSEIRSLSAK